MRGPKLPPPADLKLKLPLDVVLITTHDLLPVSPCWLGISKCFITWDGILRPLKLGVYSETCGFQEKNKFVLCYGTGGKNFPKIRFHNLMFGYQLCENLFLKVTCSDIYKTKIILCLNVINVGTEIKRLTNFQSTNF